MIEQGLLTLHPTGLLSLLPRRPQRPRRPVRRPSAPTVKRGGLSNAIQGMTRGPLRVRSIFPFTITRK